MNKNKSSETISTIIIYFTWVIWLATSIYLGIHTKSIWVGLLLAGGFICFFFLTLQPYNDTFRKKLFLLLTTTALYLIAGLAAKWNGGWVWFVPVAAGLIYFVDYFNRYLKFKRKAKWKAEERHKKEKKSRSYRPSYQGGGMPVIDLRSTKEKNIESGAGLELQGEDEEIAQKLAKLSTLSTVQYSSDKAAYEKTVVEFRKIGEQLCANGGDARMKRIAYRVKALGGSIRLCEMYWDGICGWMY